MENFDERLTAAENQIRLLTKTVGEQQKTIAALNAQVEPLKTRQGFRDLVKVTLRDIQRLG